MDGLFFNVSHAGDYVVGVLSDCEVGCDIEKNANAPLEVAEHYFYHSELAYIKAAEDKDKAFFTLWTLKESYMKMTGRGMSLPLDSFEVVPTAEGFVLGKSSERPCFFETMEFDGYIFSVSSERAFSLHNPLKIAFDDIYVLSQRIFQTRSRVPIRQESVYVRYCFCCTGELRKASEQVNQV